MSAGPGFTAIDWLIVLAYLAGVLTIGFWFARRQKTMSDYFHGARSIPVWAAAVSIVATSVSAVTFLGAPEDAYNGDLTYLSMNLAAFFAVIVVAVFFVPAFYRENVSSIYELLGRRFGTGAQRAASASFLIGRVLASGARLYVAAIPFSLIVFGDIDPAHLLLAIGAVSILATAYTMAGGIRAVIWTEAPQTLLFLIAASVAIGLLLHRIPVPMADLLGALGDAKSPSGASKLTVLDTRLDLNAPFSLWSALTGLLLFNLAVYGADHDLTQRMLTCRNAIRGGASAILSNLIGIVVAFAFLSIGLLLYIFYTRPDLMGAAAPGAIPQDSRQVFLHFILHEVPPGLRGLMLSGLFATAMSSHASALSAMAAASIADFHKPRLERLGRADERTLLRASRAAVALWGVVLGVFAGACVFWQRASGEGLLQFAIGVMVFAYAGLLALFLAAIFTKRGNGRTAVAALVTGFVVIAVLRFGAPGGALARLGVDLGLPRLALGWQMLAGVGLSFLVCVLGVRRAGERTAAHGA